MKFTTARCEICLEYYFEPKDVVAYAVQGFRPRKVDLDGKQPWSGVRCLCQKCIQFVWELRDDNSSGRA